MKRLLRTHTLFFFTYILFLTTPIFCANYIANNAPPPTIDDSVLQNLNDQASAPPDQVTTEPKPIEEESAPLSPVIKHSTPPPIYEDTTPEEAEITPIAQPIQENEDKLSSPQPPVMRPTEATKKEAAATDLTATQETQNPPPLKKPAPSPAIKKPTSPPITPPAKKSTPKPIVKPIPKPVAPPPTESTAEETADAELDESSEQPTEEQPPAEEEGVPIDFPIIGTVTMYSFDDADTQESGMRVYFPAKGTKLEWGPLVINNGRFQEVGEKMQYFADASLFGSKVTLGIKDLQKGSKEGNVQKYARLVLEIKYAPDSIPTLKDSFTGQEIQLNSIELVLEQTKPLQLIATTTLFKQKVPITFVISKTETSAMAELKAVPLVDIIPSIKGTPIEAGKLNSFKIMFNNIVSKEKKPRELVIEGSADLSSTPGLDQTEETKSIAIIITLSSKQQSLKATANKATIPGLGVIHEAAITANLASKKKEISLQGNSDITIPGVGTFATQLIAQISAQGITFDSKIQQTVVFAGINIHNIELKFATADKTLKLIGDATLEGYKVQVSILKDAKDMVSAQAALSEKELKPFSKLNKPIVSDITITDPSFTFLKKGNDYEMQLHGGVTIFGIPLTCDLFFKKTPNGQTVTLAEIEAPKDWKLSDGIHALRGTLFDQITIQEFNFIFSSGNYVDTTRDITFRTGFNFVAKTKLTGLLVPVSVFTKTPSESLITLQGYIATDNPLNSVFKAQIPNGVVLKQEGKQEPRTDISIGKLELEVAGNPIPSFSLLTTMQIRPTSKDELLTLTGRIMFRPPSIAFAGTMQGTWKNPIGIKNLEVSNVAAEIAFGPSFPETGIPDSIGVAGEMAIGKRHFAMALKMPIAGQSDTLMCGALDQLTLEDLIDVTEKIAGTNVSFGKIPDALGIRNLKMYMAPKDTTIGELTFEQGLTMRGVIFVPGFTAMGNITISSSGFILQASCSEIKYGPLLISRAKEDKTFEEKKRDEQNKQAKQNGLFQVAFMLAKKHADEAAAAAAKSATQIKEPPMEVACKPDNAMLAEYNGPTMRVMLNAQQPLDKQGVLVSGLFKLGNIFEQDAFMKIDKEGIEFNLETAIGKEVYNGKPLLDSKIFGKSSGELKSPDFKLSVDFHNNFQAYLLAQIKVGIQKAKIEVTQGVANALAAIDTTKELNPEEVGKKVDEAERDVLEKREQIKSLNEDISRLNRQIGACT